MLKDLIEEKEKILEKEQEAEVILGELPLLGDILVAEKTGLKFTIKACHGRDRFMVGLLRPDKNSAVHKE
jgi:hypothetical protein